MKRQTQIAIPVAMVILPCVMAGCSHPAQDMSLEAWREIDSGPQSAFATYTVSLLTDAQSLDQWWNANSARGNPHGTFNQTQEPPSIDFTRSEVLAITLGERSTNCWAIHVQDVRKLSNATLGVSVVISNLSNGSGCQNEITRPYVVARIDSTLPVGEIDTAPGQTGNASIT